MAKILEGLAPVASRDIISGISFHTSLPFPLQEHQSNADPSQPTAPSFPESNRVFAATQPKVNEGARMKEAVTRAPSQEDSQIHVEVLERLIRRTAEGVENIPIFLELLDQPVKYPTLQPNNLEEWK